MGSRSIMRAIARDIARAQRRQEAEQKKLARARIAAERERQQMKVQAEREQAKTAALAEKQAKQHYLEDQHNTALDLNTELEEQVARLQRILEDTLDTDDTIRFDSLRIHDPFIPTPIPDDLLHPSSPPQRETFVASIKPPEGLQKLLPGSQKKYEQAVREAEAAYQAAVQTYGQSEVERTRKLRDIEESNNEAQARYSHKVQQRNQEVAELEQAYQQGEAEAIVTYISMVLDRSVYPDDFPQTYRLAYVPESQECVVEYELPGPDVVPAVADYRYVKTQDTIQEKPRKAAEIKALYQDVVAAVCLRTIHEIFESDQHGHLQLVTFNGFVHTIEPSTGQDIFPHLISVRVTKERFEQLDLRRVEKHACLRNLGAHVSARPSEMIPVKPVVEFSMVDKRFVDQDDLLGELDGRTNLMDLTPTEFETLVSNMFTRMGLETRQTRATKDGGVDAIAFDMRPILGGKVVIQAKRYKNTVGVSAVRDLYGTMMNEGANKGIIVTTSSYGPDAYDFVRDKPIELIDGGGLLYVLAEVGITVRIVFPQEG